MLCRKKCRTFTQTDSGYEAVFRTLSFAIRLHRVIFDHTIRVKMNIATRHNTYYDLAQ